MMVSLAAALAAVAFPGGDWSDLCKSIAESTKKPVVALAGANERAKAFGYDPEQPNEMARAIFAATGFKQAPGLDAVFHHGRLAHWNFQLTATQLLEPTDQAWGVGNQTVFDGDRVEVLHKPGQATVLGSVIQIGGKRLKVHWTLERYAYKGWLSNVPVKDFLGLLAKAAGGRLTETKERYEIELDAMEYRRRALATLDAAAKRPEFKTLGEPQKDEWELSRAALSEASAPQIAEAMEAPAGKTRILIGGGLRSAVQGHVAMLMRQPAEAGSEDVAIRGRQPRERSALDVLRNVDPRVIGYVELNAMFQVRIFLQTVDGLGRPGPMVAIP